MVVLGYITHNRTTPNVRRAVASEGVDYIDLHGGRCVTGFSRLPTPAV